MRNLLSSFSLFLYIITCPFYSQPPAFWLLLWFFSSSLWLSSLNMLYFCVIYFCLFFFLWLHWASCSVGWWLFTKFGKVLAVISSRFWFFFFCSSPSLLSFSTIVFGPCTSLVLFFTSRIKFSSARPRSKQLGEKALNLCYVHGETGIFFQKALLWGHRQQFQTLLEAQVVKNPPAVQETWVWSLGLEDAQRRKWVPTPVFLPGKSHGQRSLASYSPWGHKESDTTEQPTHSSILGKTKLNQITVIWDHL